MASSYYQAPIYDNSRAVATIGDMMLRGPEAYANAIREAAQARARAAEIGGQAKASIASSIGSVIPQTIAAKIQADQIAMQRQLQGAQLADMKAQADQRSLATEEAKNQQIDMQAISAAVRKNTGPDGAVNHQGVVNDLQTIRPRAVSAYVKEASGIDALLHPALEKFGPGDVGVDRRTNQSVVTVPEKPPAPSKAGFAAIVGDPTKTPEQRAVAQAALSAMETKPNPDSAGAAEARYLKIQSAVNQKQPISADDAAFVRAYEHNKTLIKSTVVVPPAAVLNDVKETVAGMKDGTLPPMMPGRATKEYLATMAEAHRQGYDLQAAVTDWNATQKHIATMNGNQQTRLNQSINALPDLLDSIDDLASKWKGGPFPILNRANLALAKNGVYGEDVATIARQLDSQIADVTADLGNVYMGGNSPTDHALALAGKALSGDWSEKSLHDMVARARSNVTIRQNSIKHTGVQGASENNPYAPPQAPAAAIAPAPASLRQEIPGHAGKFAISSDGGKTWKAE